MQRVIITRDILPAEVIDEDVHNVWLRPFDYAHGRQAHNRWLRIREHRGRGNTQADDGTD